MPLTLASGATLAADQAFQARVAMAFYYVAREVLEEAKQTDGHEVRANFARSIVMQPYTQFLGYAAVVATDQAVISGGPYTAQTGVGDDKILAAVRGMWNRIAGVQG